MGKASSAKKVARAARAGGNRRPGQRRQLAFPAMIAVIVLVGVGLVVFARSSRDATAAPLSQANQNSDHWHAAFGFSQCGSFLFDGSTEGGALLADKVQPDGSTDPQGIHTHEDGLIHIHPFLDSAGGRNARVRIFFEDIGVTYSDSKMTLPDGTVWDESETRCTVEGEEVPGQIVLARWNDVQQAADGERPSELVTEDFGNVRFRNNREYYAFAFVPEGQVEDIAVLPGALESVNRVTGAIDAPGASTTSTTGPGGTTTSTTAPPGGAATTTTAPAGGTTTTAP